MNTAILSQINILAAVSGEGIVRQLGFMLVIGICAALIWLTGKYFITKLGLPPIAMTVWNAIFILVGLFVAINFLLGLIGKPLVKW